MADVKNATKVKDCVCSHDYQDQKYGARKRLMNPRKGGYRCTVCRKEYVE